MTSITGTLLLEQLLTRDNKDNRNSSPGPVSSPASPETPRQSQTLVRLRRLMHVIHESEASSSSSRSRRSSRSQAIAKNLWREVKKEMETDEDYLWLNEHLNDVLKESLEEAESCCDPKQIQSFLSVPDMDESYDGKNHYCDSDDEMDPEMGLSDDRVSSPPVSLASFTHERILRALERMASQIGEDTPMSHISPPLKLQTLDLMEMEDIAKLVPTRSSRPSAKPARGSFCRRAFAAGSVLLVVSFVTCMIMIRFIPKQEISGLLPLVQQFVMTMATVPIATTTKFYHPVRQSLPRQLQKQNATPGSHQQGGDTHVHRYSDENAVKGKHSCIITADGRFLPAFQTPREVDNEFQTLKTTTEKKFSGHLSLTVADQEESAANDLQHAENVRNAIGEGSENRAEDSVARHSIRGASRKVENKECNVDNIFAFAQSGFLEDLRRCLSLHPEWINQVDENDWSVIHEAAMSGWLDIVEYLVQAGASVTALNNFGNSAYQEALLELGQDHEVTGFLLQFEENANLPSDNSTRNVQSDPTAGSTRLQDTNKPTQVNLKDVVSNQMLVLDDPTKQVVHLASTNDTQYGEPSLPVTSEDYVVHEQKKTELAGYVEGNDTQPLHGKPSLPVTSEDSVVHEQKTIELAGHVKGKATIAEQPARADECAADQIPSLAYDGRLKELTRCLLVHPEWVNKSFDQGWTPLHYATRGGHLDIVEFLLQAGANVNARTVYGQLALDIATKHQGYDEAVPQALLRYASQVQAETASVEASVVRFEISAGMTGNISQDGAQERDNRTNTDNCSMERCRQLIHSGELENLQRCMALHPDLVNRVDEFGWTALHEAARAGRSNVVDYLLHSGANVETLTFDGQSARNIARRYLGDDHVVTKLLLQHTDPQPKDEQDVKQGLHFTDPKPKGSEVDNQGVGPHTTDQKPKDESFGSQTDRKEVASTVQIIDFKVAGDNKKNVIGDVEDIGTTATTTNSLQARPDCVLFSDLLKYASFGELDQLQYCLSLHPEWLNQPDPNQGWTALHEAARAGRVTTVEYLLQAGANTNVLTKYGQHTPLDLARTVQGEDHAVVKLLLLQQSANNK